MANQHYLGWPASSFVVILKGETDPLVQLQTVLIACPSPLKLGHYFGMERGFVMARKRHSDEDILKLLREIEVKLSNGSDVASACRGVGISDATYYNWRKRFGGMGRSQLSEMRSLEKENTRLKKIVAELELDKLILKESLSYLKPRA